MGIFHDLSGLALRKAKRALRSKYRIGKYFIKITPGFPLPDYQSLNKLYDHFLPVLAKYLDSQKLIIDVGANIGDTAIALVQSCSNPLLCIEASDEFFPYLRDNLKLLPNNDFVRVRTVKKLAGTGAISGALDYKMRGTAGLKQDALGASVTHTPLDELVTDPSGVILIKVDTDGFDFDVLRSAAKILQHSEPVLFWENVVDEDFQLSGFNNLYPFLQSMGYNSVYIFDNYGNLIIEETGFSAAENINRYIHSMKNYNCTRTIHYTDILASTEKNRSLVEKAVLEYKTEWIMKPDPKGL
ncbi:MAG: FkbM family methyltransferase [Ignavibacteria bacterium]|jgi:FkbM family methyltransferase|nr:FkbM family methyltransferase [Ignavibacteria bacterium]MCU7503742.1 FkbM family methyltransferase [Ignavibacteria bacterium]MCU7517244.1 FkbM family methyltransferase [Ignavibacteria bacterium]